jgi:hypothetical protein
MSNTLRGDTEPVTLGLNGYEEKPCGCPARPEGRPSECAFAGVFFDRLRSRRDRQTLSRGPLGEVARGTPRKGASIRSAPHQAREKGAQQKAGLLSARLTFGNSIGLKAISENLSASPGAFVVGSPYCSRATYPTAVRRLWRRSFLYLDLERKRKRAGECAIDKGQ